jgi:hypothetical protein
MCTRTFRGNLWSNGDKKIFAAGEFIPYIARSPHQWRELGFTALSGFFVASISPHRGGAF